ncbi:hypothetical protein [Streptomyces silvisoli]|uniref:Uncharacterized protein n=1 Tax=Streptomyces silvisoli TaxID=3034235 RepID=A0ABT5ZU85_9ACTN|nr:hypothetical protein [Streptomyces silvisoli]MDF3293390.1 hypothetical protein [Streptomyces silvisoli]
MIFLLLSGRSEDYGASVDRLRRVAVMLALGEQPVEELPTIAAESLEDGLDTPGLRELAGLSRRDHPADIRALFAQAMEELGSPVPDTEEAWRQRMLWAARAMVAGTLRPYNASNEIYWCACHLERTDTVTGLVDQFTGLWSTWEDWPDERAAIERDMLQAAAELLHRYGSQPPK